MGTFRQDLRYGLRVLAKSPAFAVVAVLTLALGISASTTVFTLIKGVVLRPLPAVRNADQLVIVISATKSGQQWPLSYPDYRDLQGHNETFSGLFGSSAAPLSINIGGRPERVWGEIVTGNAFEVMGVHAALGRTFTPEDDRVPGGHPVAMISDGFWKGQFGSDPGVIGKSITIGTQPFTIVGVTEPKCRGTIVGLSLQVFVPTMMQREVLSAADLLEDRDSHWLITQGRLKPGVKFDQAQASLAVLGEQLSSRYRNEEIRKRAVLLPLAKSPFGSQAFL